MSETKQPKPLKRQFARWLVLMLLLSMVYPLGGILSEYGPPRFLDTAGCVTYVMDKTTNGPLRVVVVRLFPALRPDITIGFMLVVTFYYLGYWGLVLTPMLSRQKNVKLWLTVLSGIVVVSTLFVSLKSEALFPELIETPSVSCPSEVRPGK